jgi:hypothetical protein
VRCALLEQLRRWHIPALVPPHLPGSSGPLKSDCPLECVRACRVCTGCRRDVDRARRQIGINVWIDGKTVRASRAHVPDHQCRCECSLTAATVRRPHRPILWAGRAAAVESPAPRGAGPIGPVPRGADPARFGRCAAATVPRTRRPRAHHARSDPLFTPLERRYNGSGRPVRPRPRPRRAAPHPAVWAACSGRSGRRRRPMGRPREGAKRVLGHFHTGPGRARAAQVGAAASGAPGSSGPAPGRSGPARGGSLAVPRPERASGACLRASRGRSRAERACAKKKRSYGVNTWAWWCEYV